MRRRGAPGALSGGIILMHLNTLRRADRPHEALPDLLMRLQAQGYRLVPVSALLAQSRGPQVDTASIALPRASAAFQALIRWSQNSSPPGSLFFPMLRRAPAW